jgi:predicted nucleotidyltransferase
LSTIVVRIKYNYMEIFGLKKSKTREKILRIFFADTDKKYYLRELEKILKISVGNIRRELLALEKSGLFKREEKGKQVYYFLNKEAPIYEEFKSIVLKTIGLEHILKEELKRQKDVDFSFLFGSYVKGDFKSDSDVDLYVIGDIAEDKLYKAVKRAERMSRRNISYHFSILPEFKKNLKNSFFHKEIIAKHLLLTGDPDEFAKIIGGYAAGRKN